ncbi:YlzJ-like protein [Thermosyntropha lipolytica DSM 11003]|uniref:YlzJ-like protein n=1 Tax=Thermosyntropha lipolytica DSM 11003 TaxID=1123382 RepID=A0A1M5RF25_9FIRM|nr:YlzJ-like family protein [Thermosyntropha lipolytica]SHH24957.1 YlzJ-like protein [Thermosyntropha lipolytica DSM 11003]
MIIYVPEPMELYNKEMAEIMTIKLASGGIITAEPYGQGRIRVLSINSTDPMDYMEPKYQPGSILDMKIVI